MFIFKVRNSQYNNNNNNLYFAKNISILATSIYLYMV